jgi:hypothetical protein
VKKVLVFSILLHTFTISNKANMIIKQTNGYPDAIVFTVDDVSYTLWEVWSGDTLSFDLFKTTDLEQGELSKKIDTIPSESIMADGEFQWAEIASIIESIELNEIIEAEVNEVHLDENFTHEWFENIL